MKNVGIDPQCDGRVSVAEPIGNHMDRHTCQHPDEGEVNVLWDEAVGAVAGGTNWSVVEVESFLTDGYVALSGPELPEVEVPW